MTKRSVVFVIVFTLITFGLYHLYWQVKTKDEMVSLGANIPTGWLLLIPIANLYWLWKWSEGVDHVSRGKLTAPVTMLFMLLLPVIGTAIVQVTFNKVADEREDLPRAWVA